MALSFPGSSMVTSLLSSLGLDFDSATRLYRLEGEGAVGELMVESWSLQEALDRPFTLEIYALSLNAGIDIQGLLGQTVTLQIALSGGETQSRSAIVFAAASEEADGGFARYHLTLRPWTQLMAHTRQSRVWQEKTTVEIVEDVFSRYAAHAQWRWADDVSAHMAQSPYAGSDEKRSYTVQYRETDLAFVTRLLAEEGLGTRIEQESDDDEASSSNDSDEAPRPAAPCQHTLVIFADSPSDASCPEDATSEAGDGIRFHRSSSVETVDTVQAFGGLRALQAAASTTLAWDYGSKRSIAASVPTNHNFGGENAPRLESYRAARAYAYSNGAQAQRAATLSQEAIEVRNKRWIGRSTVRTLQAGTSFTLTDSPLDEFVGGGSSKASEEDQTRFLISSVTHAGINNLPKDLSEAIAGHFDSGGVDLLAPWVDAEVRVQATKTGYGNAFEATRAYVPWRPEPIERPKAPGPLTAEVVGGSEGAGAEEIHTDRLGRIRIRHDFQGSGESSTWVRVLQPFAGSSHGLQFIPRIGQQVLVDFFDDDIERPFVRGAVFNGRGEGGVPATTGGKPGSADLSAFGQSADHTPSAQGNQAGGNAPPWHAASAADISASGQRNAGALSGWKTKEFSGSGFNQLVFDDSNGQLRTQLSSTQFGTQLNMGHLIHQADNHRGSFRGLGLELRTDAYGVLRGARGMLLSSYGINLPDPSGDNSAGIALAAQLKQLTQTFNDAAKTHEAVTFAGTLGSAKANASVLSDKEAPVMAIHTALKGMVAGSSVDAALGDAGDKKTDASDGKVPQLTDPVIAISARAGLAMAAGQDVAMLAGENLVMGAGQDLGVASGGSARVHSGQAIGVLGGAIAKGSEAAGTGFTLIAGKGDIDVQAQADKMQVAAKKDVQIQSKSSKIDWAAAKKITLATKDGASIVIEGGNITVMCPGKISVKAAKKSFVAGESVSYDLPTMPSGDPAPSELKYKIKLQDIAGHAGKPQVDKDWAIVLVTAQVAAMTDQGLAAAYRLDTTHHSKTFASGNSGQAGDVDLDTEAQRAVWEATRRYPGRVWLVHGVDSVPLTLSSKTQADGIAAQERVLDASNYLSSSASTTDALRAELKGWAEYDHQSALMAKPKQQTEL